MRKSRLLLATLVLVGLTGCVDDEPRVLRDRSTIWADSVDSIAIISDEASAQVYSKMRKPLLDAKLDKVAKRWTAVVNNLDKKEAEPNKAFKQAFKDVMDGKPLEKTVVLKSADPTKADKTFELKPYQIAFIEDAKLTRETLKKEAIRLEKLPEELAAKKLAELQASGEASPDANAANFPGVREAASALKNLQSMFTLE